jgi:hypothetical protein
MLSHSGVSVGDAVEGSSWAPSTSTRSARSPRASSSRRCTSAAAWSGQGADVELEVDGVGDHVGLRAAVDHRGGDGGVGAGVELAAHAQRQGSQMASTKPSSSSSGPLISPGSPSTRRTGARCRASGSRRPERVEAAHHLGRGDQRVVGAERLAGVAGRAPDPQRAPVGALLAHDHRQAGARRRVDREPAGLGDDVVGGHVVAVLAHQGVGAPGAQRLLVGHRGVHQRARGRKPPVARRPRATAIDAVRFSMSTAPRPQTSSTPSSVG